MKTKPRPSRSRPAPTGDADAILASMLERRIKQIFISVATDLLMRKAGAEGATLTVRQKATFSRWLEEGGKKPLVLRFPRKVSVHFSPRDLRRLKGKVRQQAERDGASGAKAVLEVAPKILRREFNRTWPAYQRDYDRRIHAFERRLARRYAGPFRQLALLNTLARDLGDQVNDAARRARKPGKHYRLVEALTRLHARACQIACEVAALLKCGYADGAMARWRSLHEVSVTLQFIAKHGAATADRYLDHEVVESHKAAVGYNKMSGRLGHEPYTKEEMALLAEVLAATKQKHDRDFGEDYGWAAKILPPRENQRLGFADIEQAIGLDHFRPYYKLASHNVHAGPKGILFRLGVPNPSLLPTGPSNLGLTEPAANAALSLVDATMTVVALAPSLERWAHVAVLKDLVPEIGAGFDAVEKAIEADEERIQRAGGSDAMIPSGRTAGLT